MIREGDCLEDAFLNVTENSFETVFSTSKAGHFSDLAVHIFL